jgi:hypothetical protein
MLNVYFLGNHGEAHYPGVIEALSLEFQVEILDEITERYSPAFYFSTGPKEPFSPREMESIENLVKGGSRFALFTFPENERRYEDLSPMKNFIKSLFNADFCAERMLEVGEYEVEYYDLGKVKKKIEMREDEIIRKIRYYPKRFLSQEGFEVPEQQKYVSFFTGCEEERIFLKREVKGSRFSPWIDAILKSLVREGKITEEEEQKARSKSVWYPADLLIRYIEEGGHSLKFDSLGFLEEEILKKKNRVKNVGIVDSSLDPRAFCFVTSTILDEIEYHGENYESCKELINSIIFAGRREVVLKPQPKPSLMERVKGLRESLDKNTSDIVRLGLKELALELENNYGDSEMAGKIAETGKLLEERVLPGKSLREKELHDFRELIVTMLNEVEKRQERYAENVQSYSD